MITIDDLKKIEIRIGKVISAEKVEGSEKLIKFIFDIGGEERQIIGGLGLGYPDPSVLIGRAVPLVLNLEPRKLMGLESQGMILAPSDAEGRPAVLSPDREVPPGTEVR
jgi:methionine--tRNA ligase beta chain